MNHSLSALGYKEILFKNSKYYSILIFLAINWKGIDCWVRPLNRLHFHIRIISLNLSKSFKPQYNVTLLDTKCNFNTSIFENGGSCKINVVNRTVQTYSLEAQIKPNIFVDNIFVSLFLKNVRIYKTIAYFRFRFRSQNIIRRKEAAPLMLTSLLISVSILKKREANPPLLIFFWGISKDILIFIILARIR